MFVNCPKCGKAVSDDSAFCPYCGAAMNTQPPQEPAAQPEPQKPASQPANNAGSSVNPGVKPDNYLVWSIITTAMCCVPFGVIAILKSNEVDSLWNAGKFAEAQALSNKVKNINLITMIVTGAILAIYMIISFIIVLAGSM